MTEHKFGYPLSVLEGFVNATAHQEDGRFLDRQLTLGLIERLEHIAIALENLSDVGDVVASKLVFGTVPDESQVYGPGAPIPGGFAPGPLHTEARYGSAPPSPGAGPVSPLTNLPPVTPPVQRCDVPGCIGSVAFGKIIDGVTRSVCADHKSILGGDNATPGE